MSDTLIRTENVSKKFCRSLKRSMLYGTLDTARTLAFSTPPSETLRKGEFWALRNVSFELKRGDTLALVGKNGCGKSTLLRLLHGVLPLDTGRIEIRGRIGALIAVGAGFHPHMTGQENIWLNGTLLGLSRSEIAERFDDIVDFADIGEFLDAPVATYSSGMRVRLGFAIAIHAHVDILLIDEVLAVGDLGFRGKCYNRLKKLKEEGVGIVLVSHEAQNLLDHCKRGLLLNHGKLICDTDVFESVKEYERILIQEARDKPDECATGRLPVKTSACLRNADGVATSVVDPKEHARFCLNIYSEEQLLRCHITLTVTTSGGFTVLRLRNDLDGIPPIPIRVGETTVVIDIDQLHLAPGVYSAFFVIFNGYSERPYLGHAKVGSFTVAGNEPNVSIVDVNRKWHID